MMTPQFSWILLFGGLAFFFFGINFARSGLQFLAGDRLRLAIAKLTGNRILALGFGTFITVILQSSTATILMLMSLAATGLLSLTQAFGLILGADIGTTVVVILLSIKKISDYALLGVILGVLLEWLSRGSKKMKYAGRVLFGFGMVFYGMKLMTQTAAPLAQDPTARIIFELFANHPLALLAAAIIFTILLQTSAATIGMAMALGMAGILSLETAIPVVLGANVGTCFTALAAAVASNTNGRRVAVAHLLVKLAGVTLAMPFIHPLALFIQNISFVHLDISGNIALIHLIFNIALAVLFLPFLSTGVWMVSKMIPESKKELAFGPKYLDEKVLEAPPVAFAQAKREILRVANLTYDLYSDCLKLLDPSRDFERTFQEIEGRDDKIDLLDRAIRFYLAKISQETLTESQAAQELALLSITADLEGVGDIISKELARLAQKKVEKQRSFSDEGWKDIQNLHQAGQENFTLTISTFASPSEELAKRVEHQGEHFDRLEQQFRQSHIQRLHAGSPETFETSSIHLDVLGNLRRINTHLVHIAKLSLQT